MTDDDWRIVAQQLREQAAEIRRLADDLVDNMRRLLGDDDDDIGLSGDREPRKPPPSILPTGVATLDIPKHLMY
jgi:hypothetical protein